jgi:hypothetical protein
MRGYSLSNLIFSYVGAMIVTHCLIFLSIELFSCVAIFTMLYLMQTNMGMNLYLIRIFMLATTFFILYCMQMGYFFSMHILEYKKGIWQSCKDIHRMIVGRFIFLWKILLVQIAIAIIVYTFIFMFFGFVIKILMPYILWFFTLSLLPIDIIFVVMMYNFFYIWAYTLLYTWICLVAAHVYRQLICPPTDTISCQSCNSCGL